MFTCKIILIRYLYFSAKTLIYCENNLQNVLFTLILFLSGKLFLPNVTFKIIVQTPEN